MSTFFNGFFLTLVRHYRRHLSPHIPSACAYRVCHGSESCSGIIERALIDGSVSEAMYVAKTQVRLCAHAARSLKGQGVSRDAAERIIIPCVPFI